MGLVHYVHVKLRYSYISAKDQCPDYKFKILKDSEASDYLY